MDSLRDVTPEREDMGSVEHGIETAPAIGTDERRMHVRAYNHWASLLAGRAFPSMEDVRPDRNNDFSPHSVLLDFSGSVEAPSITWLGQKLRAECALPGEVDDIAAVPPRSLLSRLTDHYMQIIANRAPIGFEAEFINVRGHNTLYRGILMPLSSDGVTIDFIYGVINWKELVGRDIFTAIEAEIAAAVSLQPPRAPLPAWADGPGTQCVDPVSLPLKADVSETEPAGNSKQLLSKPDPTREAARGLAAQAILTLPGDDEFVILVARRLDGQKVALIGVAEGDQSFLDRALQAVVAT